MQKRQEWTGHCAKFYRIMDGMETLWTGERAGVYYCILIIKTQALNENLILGHTGLLDI